MTEQDKQSRILAVGAELPPLTSDTPRRTKTVTKKRANWPAERFQSINNFVDVSMATLTPSERSIWLILWRDTKPVGLARTSQMDMARRAGITDRQARNALKGLREKGLLTVVRQGGLRQGSTIYRVHPVAE